MNPAGSFTTMLWESVQKTYEELITHPFILQLAEGTLSAESFAHYLSQDVLYIRDDAQAFKILAQKAPNQYEQCFFDLMAQDIMLLEQELQNYFLKLFKVEEAETKSPVIERYTLFLLTHAEKSLYPIAAAALLPCFWVYNEVGNHIYNHSADNNIYQKWIDTFKSAEYENYTKKFIEIVERAGESATDEVKKQMRKAFVTAAELELSFFEESVLI